MVLPDIPIFQHGILVTRRRLYRPRLRMAHPFNRVGNAPRVGISPAEPCSRDPLGTRLNESMPTACVKRRSV